MNATLGQEKAREMFHKSKGETSNLTKFEMLDLQKLNSFVRVVENLQAEGHQVKAS